MMEFIENLMKLVKNSEDQSLRKLTHIKITDPDGNEVETDVEMWAFVGINDFEHTLSHRVYAVSDDSIPAMSRRIQLLAMLSHTCEDISAGIVESVPGMTNEKLYEIVSYTMKKYREKTEQREAQE